MRGWSSPVAKGATLRPAATVGAVPGAQPMAVGIFSMGMAPCGLADGMTGVVPTACLKAPIWRPR
ncbi:hypothetical protein D3C72_2100160 [compost metagenome]